IGWLCCGLLIAAANSGCGKSGAPWETVHKANGQLLFQGKPVAGAQLTLFPAAFDPLPPQTLRANSASARIARKMVLPLANTALPLCGIRSSTRDLAP